VPSAGSPGERQKAEKARPKQGDRGLQGATNRAVSKAERRDRRAMGSIDMSKSNGWEKMIEKDHHPAPATKKPA
jgi:hypothetical protein